MAGPTLTEALVRLHGAGQAASPEDRTESVVARTRREHTATAMTTCSDGIVRAVLSAL